MKRIFFALTLALEQLPAQAGPGSSSAPLLLFSSGGGTISPLQSGQQLEVGKGYSMKAIPNAGYKFANWQRVLVSIDVENVKYPSGAVTDSSNATIMPFQESVKTPSVGFVMAPVTASTNNFGYSTRTQGIGWQANFTRVNSTK
jgi:hypothetical protein